MIIPHFEPTAFESLVVEIVKLLITGILGGIVGTWFSQRTFQWQTSFQTKHQDDIRRRDALRDIHASLPTFAIRTYQGWKVPEGAADEERTLMDRLGQQIDAARSLFIDDDQITSKLGVLKSLVGMDAETLRKSGVEPPLKTIKDIEQALADKIHLIESALYPK